MLYISNLRSAIELLLKAKKITEGVYTDAMSRIEDLANTLLKGDHFWTPEDKAQRKKFYRALSGILRNLRNDRQGRQYKSGTNLVDTVCENIIMACSENPETRLQLAFPMVENKSIQEEAANAKGIAHYGVSHGKPYTLLNIGEAGDKSAISEADAIAMLDRDAPLSHEDVSQLIALYIHNSHLDMDVYQYLGHLYNLEDQDAKALLHTLYVPPIEYRRASISHWINELGMIESWKHKYMPNAIFYSVSRHPPIMCVAASILARDLEMEKKYLVENISRETATWNSLVAATVKALEKTADMPFPRMVSDIKQAMLPCGVYLPEGVRAWRDALPIPEGFHIEIIGDVACGFANSYCTATVPLLCVLVPDDGDYLRAKEQYTHWRKKVAASDAFPLLKAEPTRLVSGEDHAAWPLEGPVAVGSFLVFSFSDSVMPALLQLFPWHMRAVSHMGVQQYKQTDLEHQLDHLAWNPQHASLQLLAYLAVQRWADCVGPAAGLEGFFKQENMEHLLQRRSKAEFVYLITVWIAHMHTLLSSPPKEKAYDYASMLRPLWLSYCTLVGPAADRKLLNAIDKVIASAKPWIISVDSFPVYRGRDGEFVLALTAHQEIGEHASGPVDIGRYLQSLLDHMRVWSPGIKILRSYHPKEQNYQPLLPSDALVLINHPSTIEVTPRVGREVAGC